MKLLVCTNFAQPFHTGGSEKVIQQITESLYFEKEVHSTVLTKYGPKPVNHNGVDIIPSGHLNDEEFINLIEKINPDHLFVYGDLFFKWNCILQNSKRLKMDKSIVLVGMNYMRNPVNKKVFDSFVSNKQDYKVIVHSKNYIDYKTCLDFQIPVTVINNSIDFSEFKNSEFDFKKHYGIKTPNILLCVANFFPGKGQEFLPPIIRNIHSKRQDFTFVFISSTLSSEVGNARRKMLKSTCENMNLPVLFLNDIPRSHVIEAYLASDLFVFPSQQEVSPLVILESMAARKPWLSMNVGNVPELKGGVCINSSSFNSFGMLKFDGNVTNSFINTINKMLDDKMLCKSVGEQGFSQINEEYNWNSIKKQYQTVFGIN